MEVTDVKKTVPEGFHTQQWMSPGRRSTFTACVADWNGWELPPVKKHNIKPCWRAVEARVDHQQTGLKCPHNKLVASRYPWQSNWYTVQEHECLPKKMLEIQKSDRYTLYLSRKGKYKIKNQRSCEMLNPDWQMGLVTADRPGVWWLRGAVVMHTEIPSVEQQQEKGKQEDGKVT